ncbi:MAG: (5-formylfuran-3-yl)methyl phosphate synthase [Methylococcales bacterium]|nr:(5-formylfuran-3-yl)methyl phosphate synthase [Methylococcales bacterium]MCK5924739.1 (5-formylfuran-3-yl)methyl phosphate synthase [Methylococcales bacterium]
MTGMLASVMNKEEALAVLKVGVDIIDLKQPSKGALGALEIEEIAEIVQMVQGRCLISATIGDLPMEPKLVFDAIKKMATTQVDYIKIGFFPKGNIQVTLNKLSELKPLNLSLIAVLFADVLPHLDIIQVLKQAGFTGVMLDTLDKKQGSLVDIMPFQKIHAFVNEVQQQNLLSGLAGSLKKSDIQTLMTLKPDYLGFRGALCHKQNRISALEHDAVLDIKAQIVRA